MARKNKYTCRTCGDTFERCIRCMVAKPNYDAENFCIRDHADIYAILSKHGCNLITADEALAELKAYNIDEIKLAEDVAAHIARIKSEATVKDEVPTLEVVNDKPIVKTAPQSNKNKKKKW